MAPFPADKKPSRARTLGQKLQQDLKALLKNHSREGVITTLRPLHDAVYEQSVDRKPSRESIRSSFSHAFSGKESRLKGIPEKLKRSKRPWSQDAAELIEAFNIKLSEIKVSPSELYDRLIQKYQSEAQYPILNFRLENTISNGKMETGTSSDPLIIVGLGMAFAMMSMSDKLANETAKYFDNLAIKFPSEWSEFEAYYRRLFKMNSHSPELGIAINVEPVEWIVFYGKLTTRTAFKDELFSLVFSCKSISGWKSEAKTNDASEVESRTKTKRDSFRKLVHGYFSILTKEAETHFFWKKPLN